MGTDPSLALTGRRCIPKRLMEQGFEFRDVNLDECLGRIFSKTA